MPSWKTKSVEKIRVPIFDSDGACKKARTLITPTGTVLGTPEFR